MNYYIDFDSTIYNTRSLVTRMINSLVDTIYSKKNLDKQSLLQEIQSLFNNGNKHIYEVAKELSNTYNVESNLLITNLNNVISNGSDLVFEDSIPFLLRLKNQNNNIFLLTYSNKDIEYQTLKILGSGLCKYFDAVYITSKPKYELDIDYSNGIFIDDNPEDLQGLYLKNAKRIIRIRREQNSYSKQDISNIDIEEYNNLEKIDIN